MIGDESASVKNICLLLVRMRGRISTIVKDNENVGALAKCACAKAPSLVEKRVAKYLVFYHIPKTPPVKSFLRCSPIRFARPRADVSHPWLMENA